VRNGTPFALSVHYCISLKDVFVMETKTAPPEPALKRQLNNRHIQLIALGGAVGTGLFLGIAQTIQLAGPSVILGYAVAGLIAFFIMRQLGEMVVAEPVAGSFVHFANKYWGDFPGFTFNTGIPTFQPGSPRLWSSC
jgi:L-asparagine transporter-like permease